jgi:hypothetical protein
MQEHHFGAFYLATYSHVAALYRPISSRFLLKIEPSISLENCSAGELLWKTIERYVDRGKKITN